MPDWLAQALPDWAHVALAWLVQPEVLAALLGGSLVLFVLGLVGVPLFLARVPADFFSRPERLRAGMAAARRPAGQVLLHVLKNLLGGVLLLAGVIMLFIPGQGVLTILVALVLLDFPGKRRLQRRVLARPGVHRAINALRRRAGRPPLELPDEE